MSQELAVLQESQGFTVDQQSMLNERLQVEHIKERKGTGGKMLKYVSGDYAIATANRIFGFGKWGYRVLSKSREQVGEEEFYTADIELYVIGCPFPFPGEGVGTVKRAQGAAYATVEQHEKARKEAVTDALKRALRHYGDQFGLSLYNEDNYVEDDDGNAVKVKDVGKPQGNGYKPAPRVVDAKPAQPTSIDRDEALRELTRPGPARAGKALQAQPADEPLIENMKTLISKCRLRAIKQGIQTIADYERYCQPLIGKPGPETLADVSKLNADLEQRERAKSA